MEATQVKFTVGDASDREFTAVIPPSDSVGFRARDWQEWFAMVDAAYWVRTTDGVLVQKHHIARVWPA